MDKKEIERILPLSWNSYKHMYDSRVNNVQNTANFLLIVISFFTVILVSLFTYYENNYLFIPFAIQIISLFYLTKIYFLRLPVHWFEIEELIRDLKNKNFNEKFISDLKGLEEGTHVYFRYAINILKNTFSLLILSVYTAIIIIIGSTPNRQIVNFLSIILLLLFFMWIAYIQRQPKWGFEATSRDALKKIKESLTPRLSRSGRL